MIQVKQHMTEIVSALCAVLIILFSTLLGAQQVEQSKLYQSSAIVSSIFSQDSVGLSGLLTDGDKRDVLQKFVAAVTDAYINFELIPVNEANTFAAVYESLNDGIAVERFAYHRKNLTIYGAADSRGSYEEFLRSLRRTGHFESVTGHYYTDTEDLVQFELECTAAAPAAYLEFVQQ